MIILGAGNHAKDLMEIAHRNGIHDIALYDDDIDTGYPIPPGCLYGPLVIGVNDPRDRREIAHRFRHLLGAAPLFDPSALIGRDVHCGRGAVIGPMASLLHSVILGDHVHVSTHVSIVRSNVGDFSTLSPGAVVCGNVEIGEAVSVGAGAVICERSTIGNDCTIAAAAIVPPYSIIPDGKTVIGVWKSC